MIPLLLYLAVLIAPIIGIAAFYYLTGRVTDLDVSERGQRPELLMAVATVSAGGLLAVRITGVGGIVPRMAMVQTVLALGLAVVSTCWKISIHGAFMGVLLAVATVLYGPIGLLVLPALVIVGGSRVWLGYHSPAQYLAGSLAGAAVTAVTLLV